MHTSMRKQSTLVVRCRYTAFGICGCVQCICCCLACTYMLTDGIRRIEVLVVRIICGNPPHRYFEQSCLSRVVASAFPRFVLLSSSSTNNDDDDDTVLRSSLSSRHATSNLTQWKDTIDATIRQGSENHRTITNQL
mmetsp:Transcript_42165/g.43003  ORF Transcript_42165/g.43003 Transcript_42165/m.43003 type:complete len:136 (-) Transcript_42165:83-490(-)